MEFQPGKILTEVILITLEPRYDSRGSLTRTYCEAEFRSTGLPTGWVQCNHSVTKKKGTIRGMHWQAEPKAEDKLIRCLRGDVFDVAVDIRLNSPTFGNWESFHLSENQPTELYIPKGYAHGFQCLTDDCHLFYQMSCCYSNKTVTGFHCKDPAVAIQWPLDVTVLSDRDSQLPSLSNAVIDNSPYL